MTKAWTVKSHTDVRHRKAWKVKGYTEKRGKKKVKVSAHTDKKHVPKWRVKKHGAHHKGSVLRAFSKGWMSKR